MTTTKNLNKTLISQAYRAFCDDLRVERKKADMTMRDVAAVNGRPHSFVGKIENQERRLDVMEFVEHCRHINADPHYMLDKMIEHCNERISD